MSLLWYCFVPTDVPGVARGIYKKRVKKNLRICFEAFVTSGVPLCSLKNSAHSVQPFGRLQGTYIRMFCFIIDEITKPKPQTLFSFSISLRPESKPVSIERRLKSWNIEYNFKWNQPYLSRGLILSWGSNTLNSASDSVNLLQA